MTYPYGFNSKEAFAMNTTLLSIEEIRSTLTRLRENPNTRRNFPRELWDSIIQLTKIHSIEEVCSQLKINPLYLKRKIDQLKEKTLEFREISIQSPLTTSESVSIELSATSGLKAKIQGPISCLNYLQKLFGE
jgi:hypothetical protein